MGKERQKKEVIKGLKDIDLGKNKDIHVNIKSKRQPLPPNIMVFQTFAYLAATLLKPSSNRVLMLFFAESGYENYTGMDQTSIAEKLNISLKSVGNAVKELEDNGIIIKTPHPSDKRRIDYFLNPFTSWKGNSFSRKRILNSLPDNQLSMFGIDKQDSEAREIREIIAKSPELTRDNPVDYSKRLEEYREAFENQ